MKQSALFVSVSHHHSTTTIVVENGVVRPSFDVEIRASLDRIDQFEQETNQRFRDLGFVPPHWRHDAARSDDNGRQVRVATFRMDRMVSAAGELTPDHLQQRADEWSIDFGNGTEITFRPLL
jgi:hypothetical protein